MRVFGQPPEVVGHRGAGESIVSGLPENSLESCLAAHELGAGWVELDARLSADAELVLHHDPLLPDGRPVDEATADECAAQGIVALDDVLAGLPDHLGVDLEVKVALGDASAATAATTAGRVAARARRETRPVMVTSFNPAALLQARAVAADLPLGLVGMPITPLAELVPAALALGAQLIVPHVLTLGVVEIAGLPVEPLARVRRALDVGRANGCQTLVWGARPAQLGDLAALGVDAVCVDEIAAAASTFAGHDAAG